MTSWAFTTAGCAPETRGSRVPRSLALTAGDAAHPRPCESSLGYFRYGNSTVQFDQIIRHADTRLVLLIAKLAISSTAATAGRPSPPGPTATA